jgi:hypothetical protein
MLKIKKKIILIYFKIKNILKKNYVSQYQTHINSTLCISLSHHRRPNLNQVQQFLFFNEISEFLLVFAIFCRRHSVMVAGV